MEIFNFLLQTNETSFQGFLNFDKKEYPIQIDVKNNFVLIKSNPELMKIIFEHEEMIKQRILQCTNIETILFELKHIFEKLCLKNQIELPTTNFYNKIISEIDEIGWSKIIDMNSDLSRITFELLDKKNRKHSILIKINPSEYPNSISEYELDLPIIFNLKFKNLKEVLKKFKEEIEKYQIFWDILQDLDENCWIIEPENPLYSHTMRRIAIGKHSSLLIELNPNFPTSMPDVEFLGSESFINPLRSKLHSLKNWNSSSNLRENLESILEFNFPKKSEKEDDLDYSIECGICMCYKLDTEIPDKICDNKKCCMPFHSSCLSAWLISLPSTQQSFNTLFGQCLNCSEPISVKSVEK
eukprot:gene2977-4987_t